MAPRRFILILFLAACFFQTYGQSSTDLWIINSGSRQEKMVNIDSTIRFTPKEARQFWPIYNQYMWKWEKLMDERIHLVRNSVSEKEQPEPTKKKEFMRRLFRNDMALTRLQKKYYSRFRKALPLPKANQFMQIEYETQNRIRVIEQSILFL